MAFLPYPPFSPQSLNVPMPQIELPPQRLLIVDDLPANLKVLRGVLDSLGHQMMFATSGQQALDRVANTPPDLILLDLMMPDMDGLEVCHALQQSPQTAHIPVIFLTASHEDDHLKQAFAEGAVDYITKPFRSGELLARVQTHLTLSYLKNQARQKADQEGLIRRVITDLHYSLDLNSIVPNACNHIQTLLHADRVLLCNCSAPASCWVVHCLGVHPSPTYTALPTFTVEQKQLFTWISKQQSPSISPKDSLWLDYWQIEYELRLPLCQGDELWGVAMIHGVAPESIGEGTKEMLGLIIHQLEIAIEKAELYRKLQAMQTKLLETVDQLQVANLVLERQAQMLEQQANIDGLTQIPNRRYFDVTIDQEWRRLCREQQLLSLIMVDLDYFKDYNDSLGHLAGDECLKRVAQAIMDTLKRPADFVARYGGEEFVVVLPNTDRSGTAEIAHQIQGAIAALQVAHPSHPSSGQVTLSAGGATQLPTLDSHWTALIDQADRALYKAKQRGRSCYCDA